LLIGVYDTSSSTPIFAVNDGERPGIGSCFALEVSDDGATIFAGGKAVHARALGNGGWTMLIAVPRAGLGCRAGTVNAGQGPIVDVLLANGSAGGADHVVDLALGEPFQVDVVGPPSGPASARFFLYGWSGEPSDSSVTSLPFGIGCLCLSGFVTGGSSLKTWNNVGRWNVIGTPNLPSSPAPSRLFRMPAGIGLPVTATIQGVIMDQGSAGSQAWSSTNALILRIR
jgi:hypothetical protein